MINLKIDNHQLQEVADQLEATEKAVAKAMRSTIAKMGRWLRVRAGRAIREETQLKAEHLRKRLKAMKVKVTSNGAYGGVWIGLNPIDLKYLFPEQDGLGVSAGPPGRSQSYEGAFMGPRPGSLAPKLRGHVFKRTGKARTPIERQAFDIMSSAEKGLDKNIFKGFEEQFYKVFERELKWRMQTQN